MFGKFSHFDKCMKTCCVMFGSISKKWFVNQLCAPSKKLQNRPCCILLMWIELLLNKKPNSTFSIEGIISLGSILFDLRAKHFFHNVFLQIFQNSIGGPNSWFAYQMLYKRATRLKVILVYMTELVVPKYFAVYSN